MTDREVVIASATAIVAAVIGTTGGSCALLNSRIGDVNERIGEANEAVQSVRQDLTTQIDGLRRDLTAQIDGVRRDTTANLEGVRTEIRLLRDRVRAVEIRLGAPADRIATPEGPPASVRDDPGGGIPEAETPKSENAPKASATRPAPQRP